MQTIRDLLALPRTRVKGLVQKKNKREIARIEEEIRKLESLDYIVRLEGKRLTRQRESLIEWEKLGLLCDIEQEQVVFGHDYRLVETDLFLVSRKCSEEAISFFFHSNLVRVVPKVKCHYDKRSAYTWFEIDEDSISTLKRAFHMRIRVQYITMELIINELRERDNLRTVQIKFCGDLRRISTPSAIEPFKAFRQLDMSGATEKCVKKFSIEMVRVQWNAHCNLSKEIPEPCSTSMKKFWSNIKLVVEGKEDDCEIDMDEYPGLQVGVLPRVGPWL